MFDKDACLALLPQLTSRWKIIANVSYDNHSLYMNVKGLWIGGLRSSRVEISVRESLWNQKRSTCEFAASPIPTPEYELHLLLKVLFQNTQTWILQAG